MFHRTRGIHSSFGHVILNEFLSEMKFLVFSVSEFQHSGHKIKTRPLVTRNIPNCCIFVIIGKEGLGLSAAAELRSLDFESSLEHTSLSKMGRR